MGAIYGKPSKGTIYGDVKPMGFKREDIYPELLLVEDFNSHPFASNIRRVLDGKTKFGRLIQPLLADLRKLRSSGGFNGFQEDIDTFRVIHDFIGKTELAGVSFEKDDVLFLLTTDVGDWVRRPLLHTAFAAKLDAEVKADNRAAQRIKEMILPLLRAAAWSKFVDKPEVRNDITREYPDEKIFVDFAEAVERMTPDEIQRRPYQPVAELALAKRADEVFDESVRVSLASCADVVEQMLRIGIGYQDNAKLVDHEYYSYWKTGDLGPFKTDPGHAFNQVMDLVAFQQGVESRFYDDELREFPELKIKDATLMVVEDNSLHQLYFLPVQNGRVKNLRMYAPMEQVAASDKKQIRMESKGCFTTATRALEVMEGNLKSGGKLPTILIADQELADKEYGTDLIEAVHKRWPDMIICMIYSSNPDAHKKRLDELRDRGIKFLQFHKDGFNVRAMVEKVNEVYGEKPDTPP